MATKDKTKSNVKPKPKRDLKLNSIPRYSKASPQFVLEEHGHCEVPAGCGGVVLRWTNPHRARPVEFWLEASGNVDFVLDGKPPSSGRPMVEYGDHVLGFRISHFDRSTGILMFAGVYDEEKMIHTGLSRKSGRKIYLLSTDDGTWKYSGVEPEDDSWMQPGFDDSNWRSLIRKDFPEPKEQKRYRLDKLREFGARGLGIAEKRETVWIRKSFSLSR